MFARVKKYRKEVFPMGDFGLWTLLPPFIVIFFAIKAKRPTEALLLGCLSAYAIVAYFTGENFREITLDAFFKVATDKDNIWIILVCGLFGSLRALLNVSKSTHAIANMIGRYCKDAKSVLLSAWGLGCILFIDDYMNIITISSCLKRLADKMRVPRATMAYIIDSTGAPACVLVPFSTWAVFYAGNFYSQEAVKGLGYESAMSAYMHAAPYMFYAALSLIIVPLFICGIIPPLGAMKKEYEKIKNVEPIEDDVYNERNTGNIIDFLVPISVMMLITIFMEDMFIALIGSILSCFIMYIPRKIVGFQEFCEIWIKGFEELMPTLVLLLFAFFMKQACADINLPKYVINKCLPFVGANTFPAVAFVLVSLLAFVTGDSWGVPAICITIIVPLGAACGANVLLTMAAIISGSVFCSHACFYSDATLLTSSCCEIDCMLHAKTQIPYALIAYIITLVVYLTIGMLGIML